MDASSDLESLLASLQQDPVPQESQGDVAMPSNDQEVYFFFKDPRSEEYYVTNSLPCLVPDDSNSTSEKETIAAVAPSSVLDMINPLPAEEILASTPLPAFQADNVPQNSKEHGGESSPVPLEVLLGYLSAEKSGTAEGNVKPAESIFSSPLMSSDPEYMDNTYGVESNLADFSPNKSVEVDDLYSNLKEIGLVTSPVKQPVHSVAMETVTDIQPLGSGPGLKGGRILTSPVIMNQPKKKKKNAEGKSQGKKTKRVTKFKRGAKPKPTKKQKDLLVEPAPHCLQDTTEDFTDEEPQSIQKCKAPSKKRKGHKVQAVETPLQQNVVKKGKYEVSKSYRKVIYGLVCLHAFMRRNRPYVSIAELLQRRIIRMPARQLHRICMRLSISTLAASEEELNTLKMLHTVAWQTRNNELIPCARLRSLAKYIHTGLGMGGRELVSIFKCPVQIVNPWESSSSVTSEGDSSEQSDLKTKSSKERVPLVGVTLQLPEKSSAQNRVDVDVSLRKSATKMRGKLVHCNCCVHRDGRVKPHPTLSAERPNTAPTPTPTVVKPVLQAAGPLPAGKFTVADSGAMHDFLNKLGINTRTNVTALVSFPTGSTDMVGSATGGVLDDKRVGVSVQRSSPDSTSCSVEPNPQRNHKLSPKPNSEPDLLQYTVEAVFGKNNFGLTSPDQTATSESCEVLPSIALSTDSASQNFSVYPTVNPDTAGYSIGLSSPILSGSTCSSSAQNSIHKDSWSQAVGKESLSHAAVQNQKLSQCMQTFEKDNVKNCKVSTRTKSKETKSKKNHKQSDVICRNVESNNTGTCSRVGTLDMSKCPTVPANDVLASASMTSGKMMFEKEHDKKQGSQANPKVNVIFTPQLPAADDLNQLTSVGASLSPLACGQGQVSSLVSLNEPNFPDITSVRPSSHVPSEDQHKQGSQGNLTHFAQGSTADHGKMEYPLNANENACWELEASPKQPDDVEIPCDLDSRSPGPCTDNSFSMLEDALINAAKQAAANEASPDSGISLEQTNAFFPETTAVSAHSSSPVHIPTSTCNVDTAVEDLSRAQTNIVSAGVSGNTAGVDDCLEQQALSAELTLSLPSVKLSSPETIVVREKTGKLSPVISDSAEKSHLDSSPVVGGVSSNMPGIKLPEPTQPTRRFYLQTPMFPQADRSADTPVVAENHLQEMAESTAQDEDLKGSLDDVPSLSAKVCDTQKSVEKSEPSVDRSERLAKRVQRVVSLQTPEGPVSALNILEESADGVGCTRNEDESLGAVLRSLPDSAQPPTAAIEKMWRPYLPKVVVGGNGSIKLNMVLMKTPQNRSLLESKNKLKYLCYVFANMIAREVKAGHINYVEPVSPKDDGLKQGRKRARHQKALHERPLGSVLRARHETASVFGKTSSLGSDEKEENRTTSSLDASACLEPGPQMSLREQQARHCPKSVLVYVGGSKLIQEMLKNNAASVLLPPSDSYMYSELISQNCSEGLETKPECSVDYQAASSDSEVQFRVSRYALEDSVSAGNAGVNRDENVLKFACGRKPFKSQHRLSGKDNYREISGGKQSSTVAKSVEQMLPNCKPVLYKQNCNNPEAYAMSKSPFMDITRNVQPLSQQTIKPKTIVKKRRYPNFSKTAVEEFPETRTGNFCFTSGASSSRPVEKVAKVDLSAKTPAVASYPESEKPFCNLVAENSDVRSFFWQADKSKSTAKKRKYPDFPKTAGIQPRGSSKGKVSRERVDTVESVLAVRNPASDRSFCNLAAGITGVSLDRGHRVQEAASQGKEDGKTQAPSLIRTGAGMESEKQMDSRGALFKRKVGRPRKKRPKD